MDIVVNHTADVIFYEECPTQSCPYCSRAEFPYTTHLGVQGAPINVGFEGDDAAHQTAANFAKLTGPDFAYTHAVPKGQEHVKVPDWLNDPIFYHNRGNSTFAGESAELGDFAGLDDLMTENPRVREGFTDIYGAWIDRFAVDGFRIDTARHVNTEFLQAFVPGIRARDIGTRPRSRNRQFPCLWRGVHGYDGRCGTRAAYATARAARPGVSDEDINRRLLLAHAMLLTLRGEVVLAFNTSTQQISTYLTVNVSSHHFAALHGQCPAEATAPGSYAVTLAPLDYLICESRE